MLPYSAFEEELRLMELGSPGRDRALNPRLVVLLLIGIVKRLYSKLADYVAQHTR